MKKLFVHKDITKAKTLSTDFYIDPDYFQATKEKIFSRCRHFIGDASFVKEPGKGAGDASFSSVDCGVHELRILNYEL